MLDVAELSTTQVVFATVVAVVGSARVTRLIVADEYPPSIWVRMKWDQITHDGPWAKLVHCPWCASPYVFAVCFAWAVLSDLHWSWWVFWGWLAGSYLAAMVTHWDEG